MSSAAPCGWRACCRSELSTLMPAPPKQTAPERMWRRRWRGALPAWRCRAWRQSFETGGSTVPCAACWIPPSGVRCRSPVAPIPAATSRKRGDVRDSIRPNPFRTGSTLGGKMESVPALDVRRSWPPDAGSLAVLRMRLPTGQALRSAAHPRPEARPGDRRCDVARVSSLGMALPCPVRMKRMAHPLFPIAVEPLHAGENFDEPMDVGRTRCAPPGCGARTPGVAAGCVCRSPGRLSGALRRGRLLGRRSPGEPLSSTRRMRAAVTRCERWVIETVGHQRGRPS